jgi:hypothetical protein
MKMEWISVKEALPIDGQLVLGYGLWNGEINGAGDMMVSSGQYRDGSVLIESDCYDARLLGITHWMPLPEPPE